MRRKLVNLARELGARETDVVATYGFTEAKMAWGECPCGLDDISAGYHLYPDLGIFEVINPKTGGAVPPANPASWFLLLSTPGAQLCYVIAPGLY